MVWDRLRTLCAQVCGIWWGASEGTEESGRWNCCASSLRSHYEVLSDWTRRNITPLLKWKKKKDSWNYRSLILCAWQDHRAHPSVNCTITHGKQITSVSQHVFSKGKWCLADVMIFCNGCTALLKCGDVKLMDWILRIEMGWIIEFRWLQSVVWCPGGDQWWVGTLRGLHWSWYFTSLMVVWKVGLNASQQVCEWHKAECCSQHTGVKVAILRDLDRLKSWAHASLMKCSKVQVLLFR